jgi:hypothetical protein
MTKNMLYHREKNVSIQFGNITQNFILVELSAKAKEIMMAEAQKIHTHTVKLLSEAVESIRAIYLLQDTELLTEAMLKAEYETFLARAALTLAGDEADSRDRIEAKADIMMHARRAELLEMDREPLIARLVSLEMERQLHNAWTCAVLDAILTQTLYDGNRQRLFYSVEEMKTSLPPEVLEKLYETLVDFLSERGNAQVFLKPHTSKN